MATPAEIKKHLQSKKLVLGTGNTLRLLKQGRLARVFLTANAPDAVKRDVAHYCRISDCSLEQLGISNQEMGLVCKKPFAVSVVGLLK